MDEQRIQAYVRLIKALLACHSGQVGDVLVAQSNLVDSDLVAVMESYAEMLRGQGHGQNAVWLLGVAEKLKGILGMSEGGSLSSLSGDAAGFMVEILKMIAQMNGEQAQVYGFLRANLGRLNESLLLALPDVFTSLIQQIDPCMIAAIFNDFGNLIQQFPLGNRILNLEMGIDTYHQVLQVVTLDVFPEQWATIQNNLGAAYSNRIRGERAENLERAIACFEQVLQVHTHDAFPEDWAMTHNNLAATYCNRIRGERAENLERAIVLYYQALQVYTRDAFPKNWAMTHNNLATAYKNRIQGERADNLERAIACYHQALQVRTRAAFPKDWAGTQNNLATAYKNRIRGERADNLERAIDAYEQAFQVYTYDAFPEQWAGMQSNLANAYSVRIRGEQANNLERAIACYHQALQVFTRDAFPERWAMTKNNLASTYSERIRGERAENIEQSIVCYEQALQVSTRDAFPENWAMTKNNLATAYKDRIRGERAENIEQSIACYCQALQVFTRDAFPERWAATQNNLALAYSERIRGEWSENIEQSIVCYEQALQVRTRDAFPQDCRQTAQNLGNLYFKEECWEKAIDVYQLATAANEDSYQESISYDGKGDNLKSAAIFARNLAYAYAKLNNRQAAILTLEQSRARGLSETIDRDRAALTQLQTLAKNLYLDYQTITQQLRNREYQQRDRIMMSDRNSVAPEASPDEAKRLRKKMKDTISNIRQVPGYEHFLTPAKWEGIAIALRSDNPLIYIVTTSNSSMALIATDNAIEVLWLNDLTLEVLKELLFDRNDYGNFNGGWFVDYYRSASNRATWHNTIESTTRQLWDLLMEPIVQQLKTLGYDRATLIPTGYLSLLPLHAAWTPDLDRPTGKRYAIDDIHFTYTPNAKSLTAARSIANQGHMNSILAINNPTQDLDNSDREVQAAIETFPQSTVLSREAATVEAVRSNLGKATVVHFSCHATANFQEPLNSGLALSDSLFTLRDLLALNLTDQNGLRLAVLSACETGLPGLDNIDEVVSLPIGLLQAGVAGVVSSLWSVDEVSTMLLLTRFYGLWRKDGLEPAIALHQAQQWMVQTTDGEKASYCNLTIAKSQRDQRTYAHPFHWAAFSYLGI